MGHVLTNNHVVERARLVRVRFDVGEKRAAQVIDQDRETDLVVLQLETTAPVAPSRIADIGDSDSVRADDWAIAFGSPMVYHHTVSAAGRRLERIEGAKAPLHSFIQTEAIPLPR